MQKNKIRVILVDDEPYVLDTVAALLQEYPDFSVVGTAESRDEALEILETTAIDAAFLDIQMPNGSGFMLASDIHKKLPGVSIVFLTGHAGFALEGYDYAPVDFLVKPVKRERFAETLQRIRDHQSGSNRSSEPIKVGISTDDGMFLIDVNDIVYLEKKNRKVAVIRKSGEPLMTSASMQEMENVLSEYGFYRCHQSCLIPLSMAESLSSEEVGRSYRLTLKGVSEPIPVSRRKMPELKRLLQENISVL
ncbi:MAG: LytTR family DNA-binding domain-containing protein [Oscillospiraceae bacterium]|nr:LytTR family DNA-binding domain-containing protein [Oscillospiraceae bacterium]